MGAGHLPQTGKMVQNMAAVGINSEDIDIVIITHAHPDHIGSTLDDDGKPVYSNAHYFMFRREWKFWFSETADSKAPEHHVKIERNPYWFPKFDILPEEANASKKAILNRLVEEECLVMGMHFPSFPSLGYVIKMGVGWQWQPIELES